MNRVFLTAFLMMLMPLLKAQNFYVAHRGASHDAPENTVAAARLAWEKGADAVEIDIHLAADNRIMVIHDKDTHRTCGGKNLTIKNTPSLILRDLDAGSWKDARFKGERIPYLEEILATLPLGKTLVVEIKCGDEVIPHLSRIMAKSEHRDQVVFIAFGWETIVAVKTNFPANKALWLSGSRNSALKRVAEVKENGLDGINMQYSAIDEELVKAARDLDLDLWCWTVDDPEEAKRLSSLGITHFTTNRPQWLKQQIEN